MDMIATTFVIVQLLSGERPFRVAPLAWLMRPWPVAGASDAIAARKSSVLGANWTSVVIGASLLTPLGFVGFFSLPLWLIVVGLLLARRRIEQPVTGRVAGGSPQTT